MNRIIDANLNRATEALRVIEEIARFYLNDQTKSENLKNMRHELSGMIGSNYAILLKSRNTAEDVGIDIKNTSSRNDILDIYKANFKRLQQALRVLAEYGQADGLNIDVFEKARYDSYILEKNMYEDLSKKDKYNEIER